MVKKILMVSNNYIPIPGGVANHIHYLSKGLIENGCEVRVLHICYSSNFKPYEVIDGVEVYRCIVSKKLAGEGLGYSAKIKRYVDTAINGPKFLAKHLKDFKPDVLHWHDYYHSSILTKLVSFKGIKVCTNHSSGFLEQYEKGGLWIAYLKALVSHSDLIIGPSDELTEKSKITQKLVRFIPNGVDTKLFQPGRHNEIRVKYGEKQGTDIKLIIAPRRLDPKNGLFYFVKAIKEVVSSIPEARFGIIGGGSKYLEEQYLLLAKEDGVQSYLTITGNVPYDEMQKIIPSSDLVVIPSLMEAVSLAALEGLSCGIPVIATNVGGLPYIVNSSNGEIISPKNHQELAKAIINNLSDKKSYIEKSRNARAGVEHDFSWDAVAKKTLKAYEAVNG